jgi:hypothetical protein
MAKIRIATLKCERCGHGKFTLSTIQFVGVTTEKAQYLDLEQLALAAVAVDSIDAVTSSKTA